MHSVPQNEIEPARQVSRTNSCITAYPASSLRMASRWSEPVLVRLM